MTQRAKTLMDAIWEARDNGVDTEAKLVAFILRSSASQVKSYNAQNNLIVLCKNDLIELANEVESLQ